MDLNQNTFFISDVQKLIKDICRGKFVVELTTDRLHLVHVQGT